MKVSGNGITENVGDISKSDHTEVLLSEMNSRRPLFPDELGVKSLIVLEPDVVPNCIAAPLAVPAYVASPRPRYSPLAPPKIAEPEKRVPLAERFLVTSAPPTTWSAEAGDVVRIPTSLLVADAYDAKVGVTGDNIKTSDGANVISIVISDHIL